MFRARAGSRLLLIGGEPFGEDVLMWWNFVGRSHQEIADARADWENRGRLREGAESYAKALASDILR